eukprot:3565958-Rhodomonas_salina.6
MEGWRRHGGMEERGGVRNRSDLRSHARTPHQHHTDTTRPPSPGPTAPTHRASDPPSYRATDPPTRTRPLPHRDLFGGVRGRHPTCPLVDIGLGVREDVGSERESENQGRV